MRFLRSKKAIKSIINIDNIRIAYTYKADISILKIITADIAPNADDKISRIVFSFILFIIFTGMRAQRTGIY